MNKYNKLERKIAKILDQLPTTKRVAKSLYQKTMYLIHRKKGFIYDLHQNATIRSICDNKKYECFFGYYDKSPWSFDGRYYLVHVLESINKKVVKVGIYDIENENLKIIDETNTFNFQQGAMLRWLNKKNYYCIYNKTENNNLISQITDTVSGEKVMTIPAPIQTVNNEGTEALTLNYKRLDKIRPEYGYSIKVKNFSPDMTCDKDGIWKINLDTKKSKMIITLEKLMNINHSKTMDSSQHKINHIMYSPSGKRFIFMHRWIGAQGKFSRLYTANNDGSGLYCLLDERIVSHYSWIDDKTLIVWGRKNSVDGYYILQDMSKNFSFIQNKALDCCGDGHPSISPNKKWFVTDTYPDKARIRELMIINTKTNKKITIGKFFSSLKYDGYNRCDLHPRWSPDGKKISIDSVHEGFRNSYIINVSRIV